MMKPSTLSINEKNYSYEDLKAGRFSLKNCTPFEENTLTFCNEWLNEKAEFIIHTSGSTGIPKAITILRAQMTASARMTTRALGLSVNDKALVCLNTAYIAGKMMLARGFETGMQMTIVEPTGNPFEKLQKEIRFDFTALVPLQLQQILESGQENTSILDQMKAVIIGGAPMSHALIQKVKPLNVPVYATYGMTETVSHIALKRVNSSQAEEFFHAFEEVQLGTDERGCLTIQSVLSQHQKIVTNDIVALHEGNRFEWIGRADFVINSGGVKVQAEQVEKAIAEIFYELKIDFRFFVAGLPHAIFGEQVVLLIEAPGDYLFPEEQFKSLIKSRLSKYETPKEIHVLTSFEETKTAKLDRKTTLIKNNFIP